MFRRSRERALEQGCDPPVLTIAEAAREELLALRSADPLNSDLALWVEVTGIDGDQYTHNMYFDLLKHARPDDVVLHEDDLPVVIPHDSVDKLQGSTIGLAGGYGQGGWAIDNPNRPSPAVAGARSPAVGAPPPAALDGDVAERVAQVIDLQINPSIAMHGGRAELVGVEADTVYVRLEGGCQGCGMAKVTLGQGIEVALRDAVPEISRVVDVTDHAAGTNPYYEPAKA